MSIEIALVSGGLDSEMVTAAVPTAQPLFVNYKQTEREMEEAASRMLWPNLKIVYIDAPKIAREGVFVPARNLMFATIAVTMLGADKVWLGGMADDNCDDKNSHAFNEMSRVLSAQSGKKVEVLSPFWKTEKAEAVEQYLANGGSWERLKSTVSCYQPVNNAPCGDCPACFRWRVALLANGINVPLPSERVTTEYLSKIHTYSEGRRWAVFKAIETVDRKVRFSDIDGVLTNQTVGHDYKSRTPCLIGLNIAREWYEKGWLVLYSSRRESDRAVTEQWLQEVGLKYHALLLNKPAYDVFLDDKSYGFTPLK